MTTDAPTQDTAAAPWPPSGFNPDELPRPATFDQAIKALVMMAGKHPKNRTLVELRERRDGGALRSGDLRAFAAILELWRDATAGSAESEPAESDAEPRSRGSEGNGVAPYTAPAIELLERVRDGLNAIGDPFRGPDPIDEPAEPDEPARLCTCALIDTTSGLVGHTTFELGLADPACPFHGDPFSPPDPLPAEPEPAPAEPARGGEPLPKGQPGVAPGVPSYVAEPRVSEPAPGATEPDPFAIPGTLLHRSPSQVTNYHECGVRYRLERIEQVSDVPAWWNIGGNAFHDTVRWWEFEHAEGKTRTPDETATRFERAFSDELAKVVLAHPNVSTSNYRAASKGTEDRDWWRDHGPTMAADYVTGQNGRETDVLRLSPDVLALELGFTVDIEGIAVKGFIDQVLVYPKTGDVLIRDHKTGSRMPDDPLQLQIYAIAVRRLFDIDRPIWGAYWRARRTTKREPGETTPVRIDVDDIEPVVAWRIREMDRAERAGVYPARPSSFCGSCGVRALCPVMGPPATRRLDLLTS